MNEREINDMARHAAGEALKSINRVSALSESPKDGLAIVLRGATRTSAAVLQNLSSPVVKSMFAEISAADHDELILSYMEEVLRELSLAAMTNGKTELWLKALLHTVQTAQRVQMDIDRYGSSDAALAAHKENLK